MSNDKLLNGIEAKLHSINTLAKVILDNHHRSKDDCFMDKTETGDLIVAIMELADGAISEYCKLDFDETTKGSN